MIKSMRAYARIIGPDKQGANKTGRLNILALDVNST
jgi:hypothetical protein